MDNFALATSALQPRGKVQERSPHVHSRYLNAEPCTSSGNTTIRGSEISVACTPHWELASFSIPAREKLARIIPDNQSVLIFNKSYYKVGLATFPSVTLFCDLFSSFVRVAADICFLSDWSQSVISNMLHSSGDLVQHCATSSNNAG